MRRKGAFVDFDAHIHTPFAHKVMEKSSIRVQFYEHLPMELDKLHWNGMHYLFMWLLIFMCKTKRRTRAQQTSLSKQILKKKTIIKYCNQ